MNTKPRTTLPQLGATAPHGAAHNRQRTLRLADRDGRAILVPVPADLDLGDVVSIALTVPADSPAHLVLARPEHGFDLDDPGTDPPASHQSAGANRALTLVADLPAPPEPDRVGERMFQCLGTPGLTGTCSGLQSSSVLLAIIRDSCSD